MKVYIINTVFEHEKLGMFIPVFSSKESALEVQKETGGEITENDIQETDKEIAYREINNMRKIFDKK